ncbi:MAG: shikimate dehydrogenase [Candidatus Altiarchaeota archaeon]|nr:shikimate dehydrogenase [Candidatus Altiarchaeota archaeon]
MKVYGLIGCPVEHSVSPIMQNAAFSVLGIDALYCSFNVPEDNLGDAVQGMKALGMSGFNVTIPHKESIIPFLDFLKEDAAGIGAVNTVENVDGRLVGHNTDGRGAVMALEKKTRLDGSRILVLGAGGASRALCHALLDEGVDSIYLANRSLKRAENLCRELRKAGGNCTPSGLSKRELAESAEDVSVVVNCTSVGLYPQADETPLPGKLFKSDMVVMDIVYNPLETRFLRDAREAGAQTIAGVEMLVWQGALAFEIWTKKKAPFELMRDEALKALGDGGVK